MYSVIVLTVLVDLIAFVGIGVFIANILTIDRMSALQSKSVKSIRTADRELDIPADEKELLDQGQGQMLLVQLAGAMIFGVAKAINHEHRAIQQCRVVIFDVGSVSHLGVTAALALENAVEEVVNNGRDVYVVAAEGTTLKRLETLDPTANLPTTIRISAGVKPSRRR